VLDPDQPAEAGVHRDCLHSGAYRDAFIEHIEQRVQTAGFVCGMARAPQQRHDGAGRRDEECQG
jgi:hypothetical protein